MNTINENIILMQSLLLIYIYWKYLTLHMMTLILLQKFLNKNRKSHLRIQEMIQWVVHRFLMLLYIKITNLYYHPTMENKFNLKHNLNHQNSASSFIKMLLLIFYWKFQRIFSNRCLCIFFFLMTKYYHLIWNS